MAFTCGFFNSENGDRKYNAEQMSAIFDGIIADGVFTTIGDHMAVSAGTGMQVLVGTGKAWFDHTWNVNDAAYPLAIAASDVTLSRIDAIVLETNHSDSVRLNKLRVVQGTVASSPVKPTLTNSEKVHQHPLAWVTVAPGVTQIAASSIENAVGTAACPFVTGIIATTAIDDLFNQWNGEFDEWFDNLKAQLSDNVVANLQRQIDEAKTARYTLIDDPTALLLELPKNSNVNSALSQIGGAVKNGIWTLIQSFKKAGAYTFTVDFDGELGAYMIGGGGSGCSWFTTSDQGFSATGGASGYGKNVILNVYKGDIINIVIGAGGERVVDRKPGQSGGTTSVNGITVSGGEGGLPTSEYSTYPKGGQGTIAARSGTGDGVVLYGSRIFFSFNNNQNVLRADAGTAQLPTESQNQFDKNMVSLCAGGSVYVYGNPSSTRIAMLILPMPDGTKGGNAYATNQTGVIDGADATGNGNGGGGVISSDYGCYSGKGSDGAVYLYKRGFDA
jgi:hypothetical protein|nr:MAG TPA: Receptor Binding Protein [Caudoviricetes sp.]